MVMGSIPIYSMLPDLDPSLSHSWKTDGFPNFYCIGKHIFPRPLSGSIPIQKLKFFAARLGIEPRFTLSESVCLPLADLANLIFSKLYQIKKFKHFFFS